MIQVSEIHKSFGEVKAVRGVSFGASDGKITGLLGPLSPEGPSVVILGIMTCCVLFAMLSGCMALAIGTTAGERECGSLDPLLALPASHSWILSGKLAAICLFMTLSLAIPLCAFSLSLNFVPLEKLGMSINFGTEVAAKVFLIAWPFVLLGAALPVGSALVLGVLLASLAAKHYDSE